MSKREIGSLAFKITGVLVLVQAISLIGPLYMTVFGVKGSLWEDVGIPRLSATVGFLLPLCLELVLAYTLISQSDRLATKAFPESDHTAGEREARLDEWQAVALSVLGVYVLASALPRATSLVWSMVFEQSSLVQRRPWSEVAKVVVELVIGTGLFFGSDGLSALWTNLRTLRNGEAPPQGVLWVLWAVVVLIVLLMLHSYAERPS